MLIPVHQGGQKFRMCLSSLSGYEDLFSGILISLNSGKQNSCEAQSVIEELAPRDGLNLHVRQEDTILNPVAHLSKMLRHPMIEKLEADSPIMFLFHDDQLLGDNARRFFERFGPRFSGTVVFGPWFMRTEGKEGQVKMSPVREPTTVTRFLDKTASNPPGANVSGMIATLDSVRDFSQTFSSSRTGARMEWALIASRGNNWVTGATEPLVSLLSHPAQSGKKLTYFDFQRDEIVYQLFMLRSGRLKTPRLLAIFLIRLLYSSSVLLFAGIHKGLSSHSKA